MPSFENTTAFGRTAQHLSDMKRKGILRKMCDFPLLSYFATPLGGDALHFKGSCSWSVADEHLWVKLQPPALKAQAGENPECVCLTRDPK